MSEFELTENKTAADKQMGTERRPSGRCQSKSQGVGLPAVNPVLSGIKPKLTVARQRQALQPALVTIARTGCVVLVCLALLIRRGTSLGGDASPTIISSSNPPTIRSSKRGVSANKLSLADATALAPGVSWFYNWHFTSDDIYPDVDLAFYPMIWGSDPAALAGLEKNLTNGDRPDHVLVLNEPNLKGQAFLSPQRAASLYRSVREITNSLGIGLIGPHMAIGTSEDTSIRAFDPIEGKNVTYTYIIPYLDAFYHYLGVDDSARAIAVHSYGNIDEVYWLIGMLEETYPGKEIWITEFAWWGARNEAEEIKYMRKAVEFFEHRPSVVKYAWFKAHMDSKDLRMSLFTNEPGELTMLGKTYVNLPVGTK